VNTGVVTAVKFKEHCFWNSTRAPCAERQRLE